jgi:high-affinity Fe2+/Pb2+ permease
MRRNIAARQRRETILVLALTTLFGSGIFFFLVLIGGEFFLSMLLIMALLAALFLLHYTTWGHGLERNAADRRRLRDIRAPGEASFPFSGEVTSAERWPRGNGTPPTTEGW